MVEVCWLRRPKDPSLKGYKRTTGANEKIKSRIMTEESVFHSPSIASATLSVASSAATACSLDAPCRHLHCQKIAFGSFPHRLTSPLLTFAMTRTMACSEGVMSTALGPRNLARWMSQTYR